MACFPFWYMNGSIFSLLLYEIYLKTWNKSRSFPACPTQNSFVVNWKFIHPCICLLKLCISGWGGQSSYTWCNWSWSTQNEGQRMVPGLQWTLKSAVISFSFQHFFSLVRSLGTLYNFMYMGGLFVKLYCLDECLWLDNLNKDGWMAV